MLKRYTLTLKGEAQMFFGGRGARFTPGTQKTETWLWPLTCLLLYAVAVPPVWGAGENGAAPRAWKPAVVPGSYPQLPGDRPPRRVFLTAQTRARKISRTPIDSALCNTRGAHTGTRCGRAVGLRRADYYRVTLSAGAARVVRQGEQREGPKGHRMSSVSYVERTTQQK